MIYIYIYNYIYIYIWLIYIVLFLHFGYYYYVYDYYECFHRFYHYYIQHDWYNDTCSYTQLTVHTNLGEGPITAQASKCSHTHPVGKLVFIKTRCVTWKASLFAFHVLKLMRETYPVGPRWCEEFAGRDSNFVKDRSTVLITEFNWPSNSYSEEVPSGKLT